MPEVAVDEHSNSLPGEHYVGSPRKGRYVLSKSEASLVKQRSNSALDISVS